MTSVRSLQHLTRAVCAFVAVIADVSVFAVMATLVGGAQAQPNPTAQVTPSSVQPGAIERQFQAPPQPRAQSQPIQLPQAQQRVPAGAEQVRFGVRRIELEGARLLPQDELRELISPLENREVSLAELVVLASRLTATLRNAGFILAQVVVPQQRVDPQEAVVRLQTFEGFIDAVRFSGDVGSDATRLDAIANAIRGVRPLTAETLERYLLLLNDIPGLRAATTLTPSPAQAGAADLEIRLSRRGGAGEVSIDNRGSRAVGPWRASADIEAFGLAGTSRTAAKIVSSADRELLFGQVQHEQVVNREGTKVILAAATARSRPDLQAVLGPVSLDTASRTFSLSVHHPLIRSRTQNLYVRLGFTSFDGETRSNATLTGEDRIRALRLGLTWDRADSLQGLNVIDVELSQGLARLGASARDEPNKSRANGRPEFTKGTLYAARLQSLARRWSLLLAANAQYSLTDLLAPELFSVGGEQFGRGYDPSELLGDHGAAVKFELRYTSAPGLDWLRNYTVYGFYDAGFVRRRSPLNEAVHASLSSGGFGLRFETGLRASGFFEVAQPLTRSVASRGERAARSYGGVAAKF